MRGKLKSVAHRRHDALARVRWDRLEHLLADHYRDAGYAVEHVGTGATAAEFDGGIDLKLRRGSEYLLVQVKHWNAYKVPHNAVHELIGLTINEGASGAILATSGEFTRAAIDAASRYGHLRLIDGDALRDMLGPLPDVGPEIATASRTQRLAAHVGEHLVHTAIDRLVPGTRRRGGGGFKVALGLMAAKAAFSLIGLAGAFFLLQHAVQSMTAGLAGGGVQQRGARPVQAAQAAPVLGSRASIPVGQAAATAQNGRPCHEVVDHYSGTYIDHCSGR
ncbi:restriction endonuclease [Luteimonas sp. Y-2-2-4F]|nr:restriction endonuclease [Luteimonas sp. Y-2-2-4F]MCD9030188.1 restriction endonuclease [Luteimonas sp. Y-2-2-4F]